MKSFSSLLCLTLLCAVAQAQIKTSGIKTHYPGSGNLVVERNSTYDYNSYGHTYNATNYDIYNGSFVPAVTYPGGGGSSHHIGSTNQGSGGATFDDIYHNSRGQNTIRPLPPIGAPVFLDATDSYGHTYNAGGSSHHIGSTNQGSGGATFDDIYHNSRGQNTIRPLPPTRAPVFLDATAEFINKTRSAMASGICYKEVPTRSLLISNPTVVPVGNGTTPDMSKVQICCDGYQRNPHVFSRCDPICKDDCPNGICTAPNTCVCIPGHVRNHEEKCIATCPLGCGNGMCDDQGVCQCKPGYTLEPAQRKYCVPHCEHGCQFGKCVAPNKCDCLDGYRLTALGTCEPKCDNCENGQCTAPGFCTCKTGYLKVGGVCEPVCALGCNNGKCVAPDVCECSQGFELDRSGSKCEPHCDQPCLNGVCNGANSCACNPGYVQDEYQRNICKPHCPQGCPNGYCTSPNFCVCKPGYIKSGIKGRQTCMPV